MHRVSVIALTALLAVITPQTSTAGLLALITGGAALTVAPVAAEAAVLPNNFKSVGYMPSWAGSATAIQYSKLTHVNYSFVLPNANGSLTGVDNHGRSVRLRRCDEGAEHGWRQDDHLGTARLVFVGREPAPAGGRDDAAAPAIPGPRQEPQGPSGAFGVLRRDLRMTSERLRDHRPRRSDA